MTTNQHDSTGKSNCITKRSRYHFINKCILFYCFLNFRYKFSVLALTYVAYTCYHLTRKPISVVKTVLHRNCSLVDSSELVRSVTDPSREETWCDYAPFGKFVTKQKSTIFFKILSQTNKMLSSIRSSRPVDQRRLCYLNET